MRHHSHDPHAANRQRMIDVDLKGRGIVDATVLTAMAKVRRERFVATDMADRAYDDGPAPIGFDQTISQPYIVALMVELAGPGTEKRALEIGTGSGYQAAVMGECFGQVVTVERIASLADQARARLVSLGYDRVAVIQGDGADGYPPSAPYDAIVVAAAARVVPRALEEQLIEGGRLIIPLETPRGQTLVRGIKNDGKLAYERHGAVRFVPFVTDDQRN